MYRLFGLCFITLFIGVGCTSFVILPTTTIPISPEMDVTDNNPYGIVWRENGIFALYADGNLYRWYNEQWEHYLLPEREDCRKTVYGSLFTLPDERLATLQICVLNRDTYRILTYDWEHDKAEPFIDMSSSSAGRFIADPTMTKLAYQTINAFNNVYWITPNGLEAIPITLRDGNRSWFLPDTIEAEARWDTDPARIDKRIYDAGLLGGTEWSPNGDWIAIVATLEPMGKPLATLGYYKWNIYLINPETFESTLIIEDVGDGWLHGWSPDSQWLAYAEGSKGLWIVNIDSGARRKIYQGSVGSSAWSPDGTQMLITVCLNPICSEYELQILDLSSVLTSP